MDGNGRWAARRNQPRTQGHQAGGEALKNVVISAAERGIGILTVFAFSSENWRRPSHEVRRLLDLFMRALDREVPTLHQNGVRLCFIGARESFSARLRSSMDRAETLTSGNTRLRLNVAVNYGGRWDIVQAVQTLAEKVGTGEIEAARIDEAQFQHHVSLGDLPSPDLLIRTGGEQRISNFLLWQLAYTELYFTPVLWPDFDARALDDALADYAGRERRFGRVDA